MGLLRLDTPDTVSIRNFWERVPGIFGNLVVNSKLTPRGASLALRQFNPSIKKVHKILLWEIYGGCVGRTSKFKGNDNLK